MYIHTPAEQSRAEQSRAEQGTNLVAFQLRPLQVAPEQLEVLLPVDDLALPPNSPLALPVQVPLLYAQTHAQIHTRNQSLGETQNGFIHK